MSRREWLIALAFSLGYLLSEGLGWGQDINGNVLDPNATAAELEKTLAAGIKARRPSEQAFVRLVVEKVKNGELPISLVRSTYLWARRQPRYPAFYFERGLRERATQAGYSFN